MNRISNDGQLETRSESIVSGRISAMQLVAKPRTRRISAEVYSGMTTYIDLSIILQIILLIAVA